MLYDSLRYFCAVVKEMNFTRAAERLHMSQQTLSNHIARIESEYGISLFIRKPHLRLTYAGECFYAHVKNVLQSETALLTQFEEIRAQHQGRLSIGITQTRAQSVLPLILPEFIEQNSNVKFEVNIFHVSELGKHLMDGDLNIAVCPSRRSNNPRIGWTKLSEDQLCLTIPHGLLKKHFSEADLPGLAALPPERVLEKLQTSGLLQEVPYVLTGPKLGKAAQKFFSRYVPSPHVLIELKNTEVIYALPFVPIGATFIFRSMLHLLPHQPEPPLVVPLPMPEAFIPLMALWDRRRGLTWPAKKFITLAQKILSGQ
jgi:DNA-binding transcriptional LysR family regulator